MTKKAKITIDTPPPGNPEAEASVLGAAMIDNSCIPALMDALAGVPGAFYYGNNQKIWEAIVELHNRGSAVDLITVKDALDGAIPISEVSKLVDGIPDIAAILTYAKIVRDCAFARETAKILDEALVAALAKKKPDTARILEIVGQWESTSNRDECYSAEELARVAANDYDNFSYADVTIKTGFNVLDAYTMGLQRGTLSIWAARPGVGKTAMALNFAYNAARWEGKRVLFFSLEMPTRLMHDRLISAISGIPLRDIKNRSLSNTEMVKYTKALAELRALGDNLVMDMGSYEISSIIGRAIGENHKKKVDMVIVDFAQNIVNSHGPEQRHLNLEQTAYALVALAKKLDGVVCLMSQLNRSEAPGGPSMQQFADSSGLERAPRMASIITRGEPDCKRTLHLLKNSEGESGVEIPLHFVGPTMTFEEGYCHPGCKNWISEPEELIDAILVKQYNEGQNNEGAQLLFEKGKNG